ncbi:hypothetical protein HKT18_08070 [Flavobacterium sp. IMCC34852]|uniref:Uncharacterized protein n=1 Tax=Flavobacterium rivulicola TaxID=2732161 RepID=A0A7Y3R916_9FLAO|nr:hypothetical protein [Flavobacterium sp. IMCC34852]NNT72164.1 hypothetical protein [Flavobacterium sp. IMCC34852]
MLVNKLNLEKELLSKRKKFKSEADILAEVQSILAENDLVRERIIEKLELKSSTKPNQLNFDLLEADKIFHLEQIRTICIDYRLRFLDSNIFKNEIPEEAISKIRMLEKEHETSLEGFKIIAPSKAFHLLNYDDPLLFIPIGNDYYYLIHQWGTEMNPWRKLLVLPIKNLGNFTITSILLSIIIALLVPENNLSKSVPLASLIVFLFAFKSIFAVFAYYFFMMGKNFNEEIWQRQYYNN